MSLEAVYPLTSSMMVVGVFAVVYGLQSGSLVMTLEGFFLLGFATKLTMSMIKE
jgi:hypothetical protein